VGHKTGATFCFYDNFGKCGPISIILSLSNTPAQSDIPGCLWLNQTHWNSCRRWHWTLSSLVENTWHI